MKKYESSIYKLDNFEGQLDFLFHLVQKSEIEITDIPVRQIIHQFLQKHHDTQGALDEGADFVATTASLIWWKSKALLPEPPNEKMENQEAPFEWDLIPQLIDYCRFKQMAKELSLLEEEQNLHHFRGKDTSCTTKKNLGVEHLSIEDLALLFQQVLTKAKATGGFIQDETWKVSDKIAHIRRRLDQNEELLFENLFSSTMHRIELIVTFLAVLELMKMGELVVLKYSSKPNTFIICPSKIHES